MFFDWLLVILVGVSVAVLVAHAIDAVRSAIAPVARGAILLAMAVMAQAAIGVVTLLMQAPIGWALLHQGMALVVLTCALLHAVRLAPVRGSTRLPEPSAMPMPARS